MRSIQSCMVSRFITFLTILGMVSLARVSADQTVNQSSEAFEGASITYQTERTERGVVSRQLSEAEGKRLRIRTGVDLSLNSVAPSQQQLNWFTLAATPQLDAAPEAKAAVLRALAKWEGAFESLPPLTVRVDFGATLFGGQFSSPGTIVTTTIQTLGTFYPNLGEQLERTSFNSRQRAIYEALPLESLPSEVNSIQANAQFVNLPVTLSRIIQPILSRTNDLLSIGFNSANKFDFDPSDGIDADKLDFEALMLREVGRALGFTSSVGSVEVQFDKQPVAFPQAESIWDVFRFRDRASLAAFGTARRPQLSGGEQFFFAGGEPLALSTGRPDGRGGDGRPSGHWKDDELTGQYLGIMDPTYAPGERGGITANDLFALDYFGHSVIPRTPVIEVLSNDDNSREETLSLGGALVVNRFQPARFPCRLQSVRLQLPDGGASPVGKSLRVVVFADTRRSGRPPVSPSLLLDRSVTISAVPENRLLELMLPNGPEIEAGDIYIGWQVPAAVLLGGDANVEQQHSFISTDNGASFQPLRGAGQQPVNLIARAVVQETFGDLPIPRISSLSPATIEPGAGGFKLFVTGHHFTGNGKDGFNDTSV
ncbi:MAG TPA: NF038122 family metalloprotease, partial [Blastocatellia bacterium]|nr:NF038122 family metalloprotease [Blastocatellia bacterium]